MLEQNSGGKRVTENYVKMVNYQTFTWRKSKREVKRDRVIGPGGGGTAIYGLYRYVPL